MRDLVLSEPDDISPLSGHDLIAQKVSKIVWMDGMYNFGCAEHDTFNWLGDDTGCKGSAQAAVMNFPSNVRQIFSGVGADVFTGKTLTSCSPVTCNPVKQSFEDLGVRIISLFITCITNTKQSHFTGTHNRMLELGSHSRPDCCSRS